MAEIVRREAIMAGEIDVDRRKLAQAAGLGAITAAIVHNPVALAQAVVSQATTPKNTPHLKVGALIYPRMILLATGCGF